MLTGGAETATLFQPLFFVQVKAERATRVQVEQRQPLKHKGKNSTKRYERRATRNNHTLKSASFFTVHARPHRQNKKIFLMHVFGTWEGSKLTRTRRKTRACACADKPSRFHAHKVYIYTSTTWNTHVINASPSFHTKLRY